MTTTLTVSPELPDLDQLEALARAATPGPWAYQEDSDAYTHIVRPVASPGWIIASATQTSKPEGEANGRWIAAANPAAVLALIRLARRAQPEGEAPQAELRSQMAYIAAYDPDELDGGHTQEGMRAACRLKLIIERARAALATLSPLCGAQHAESGKDAALVAELAVAMRNNTSRHDSYVQNLLVRAHAALAAQQAAVPANTPEFGGIKTSAPGTPEAPSEPDMLWQSDDSERFACGPDEFAEDYAADCLHTGETAVVEVDCATRANKRAMSISVVGKGDDAYQVEWKWVQRAAQLDGGQEGSAT